MTVQDQGVGISAADQEKLFQPFSRLKDGHDLNPNGIGLGLSICRKVVEQFEGKIWIVQSKTAQSGAPEEHGTTFAFTMRLHDNPADSFPGLASVTSKQEPDPSSLSSLKNQINETCSAELKALQEATPAGEEEVKRARPAPSSVPHDESVESLSFEQMLLLADQKKAFKSVRVLIAEDQIIHQSLI